jgi:hypothetical protein
MAPVKGQMPRKQALDMAFPTHRKCTMEAAVRAITVHAAISE